MDDKVTKYFEEHAANPNYASNKIARWYTRLSNGQYASIQVDKAKGRFEGKLEDTYNITLSIDDSLKNIKEFFLKNYKSKSWNKIKGKGGSEGLLWAKGLLSEIIKGGHLGDGFVEIYGSDSKRFNVYKKALSKIGFEQWIDQDGDEFLARRIESDHVYSMDFRNKKTKNVGIDAFIESKRTKLEAFSQAQIAQTQKVTGASNSTVTAYHGTKYSFKDFDIRKAYKDGLYGPGHYFTSSPEIAGVYSTSLDAGKYIRDTDGSLLQQKEKFFKTQESADRFLSRMMNTNRGMEHFDKINLSKVGDQLSLKYASSIKGAGPNIRKVFLDLKNPFNMDAKYSREAVSDIASHFGEHQKAIINNILGNQQTASGASIYEHLVGYEGRYPYTTSKTNMNDILQKAGFDSIKHKGGGIGGVHTEHDVHIAFKDQQVKPFYETILDPNILVRSIQPNRTNRVAIEATNNIASSLVKGTQSLTNKSSGYKTLSNVFK